MSNSILKFFFHFARKQPLSFSVFLIAPISIVLKTNVIPYVLKTIIDLLTIHQNNRDDIFELLNSAMWLGGLSWCGFIFIERLQYWVQSKAIPEFESNMRMSVIEHTMSHSFEYFYNQFAGNIVNKVMSLIGSIEMIRKTFTGNIVPAISVITVALVLLYTVAPIFSLIISVWILLQIFIIYCFVNRLNRASNKNAEDKSLISGLIVDTISNMASVKLFAREVYEQSYIQEGQAQEKKSNSHLISLTNMFCLFMDVVITIVIGISFYFLIIKWKSELITSGDVIFVFYMIFSIMNQMWQLGYALSGLFRDIGIVRQALHTINLKPKVVDIPKAKKIEIKFGEIVFRNVSFNYIDSKNIFENVDIIIEPMQKVGIVGYSGSGKSTFSSLILRLYDINEGAIFIDGQDISQFQQSSLREQISVIMQDTNLFHRSLLDNIRYGKLDATKEEVLSASKKAFCHEFITDLPEGYNTLVGEKGMKLSGGQRQRIAIARAILKKSPILIFDEATSALDSITENLMQQGLDKLMSKSTVIVIAHRLSTLMKMDRILVFDKGQIIEDGNHENLLKAGKQYTEMWQKQVNGFLGEQ